MKKILNKYTILVLVLLIVSYVAVSFIPTPTDWTRSFESDDKNPYGSYLVLDVLRNDCFPKNEIEVSRTGIVNYGRFDSTNKKHNFIFVCSQFKLQEFEVNRIIDLVRDGNNVLIAANYISSKLQDTLNLKVKYFSFTTDNWENDKNQLVFSNPDLKRYSIADYKASLDPTSIESRGSSDALSLSTINYERTLLIQKSIGKGKLFLCSQPLAFTNINVFRNADYLAGILSYLPEQDVVWDEYYKPLNIQKQSTPLKYFLRNKGLKEGTYLLLVLVLLLLVFQAKRKQRIIPIVEAPKNETLRFIRTLSQLYYKNNNHKDIALKKFSHFKDFVRSNYLLEFKEEHLKDLSRKMGVDYKQLCDIHKTAKFIQKRESIDAQELKHFYMLIEYIYNNRK